MSPVDVERLRELAELEFADIVVEGFIPDINEVRLLLIDGSVVDDENQRRTKVRGYACTKGRGSVGYRRVHSYMRTLVRSSQALQTTGKASAR